MSISFDINFDQIKNISASDIEAISIKEYNTGYALQDHKTKIGLYFADGSKQTIDILRNEAEMLLSFFAHKKLRSRDFISVGAPSIWNEYEVKALAEKVTHTLVETEDDEKPNLSKILGTLPTSQPHLYTEHGTGYYFKKSALKEVSVIPFPSQNSSKVRVHLNNGEMLDLEIHKRSYPWQDREGLSGMKNSFRDAAHCITLGVVDSAYDKISRMVAQENGKKAEALAAAILQYCAPNEKQAAPAQDRNPTL